MSEVAGKLPSEILYRQYAGENDLPLIMRLVEGELSEPYVIYTYRYFLHQWSHLAFLAINVSTSTPVGVVVCKQSRHRNGRDRGYIGMLSVQKNWRKRGIAKTLVNLTVQAMYANKADEVVLETEFDNEAALGLYESLGFIREKRLFRFYMNGKDAFRLLLDLTHLQETNNAKAGVVGCAGSRGHDGTSFQPQLGGNSLDTSRIL